MSQVQILPPRPVKSMVVDDSATLFFYPSHFFGIYLGSMEGSAEFSENSIVCPYKETPHVSTRVIDIPLDIPAFFVKYTEALTK